MPDDLQFQFKRDAAIVIDKDTADDDEENGMLDVLARSVWRRGGGADGMTLASATDEEATLDVDNVESLKRCIRFYFRKGKIAGGIEPPVMVLPINIRKNRGSAPGASAHTAASTATAATSDSDQVWDVLQSGVLLWTNQVSAILGQMRDADKASPLMQALLKGDGDPKLRMYEGCMLMHQHIGAISAAAAGVRFCKPANNTYLYRRPE